MELILWPLYILLDAIVNWWWIEKEKSVPNYLVLTIVRGWFFILIGAAVGVTPESFPGFLLYCTTSFWVLFDPVFNKFRSKPFFYLGENSTIDQLGKKYPLPFWVLKTVSLIYFLFYLTRIL